ncbi:MAG: hypothetical protein ACRDRX_15725 [Pseudonocardiaceae bacterium]
MGLTQSETYTMDRLVPRHRRKAGSGPPANALIAWVGTDPYLREAAATVSYRRAMALPLPSHTRSAKAAIAACFMLTCGAVLGVTTIISHGRDAALYEISTPSPRRGVAGAPPPGSFPIFQAEAGSDPASAAGPVGVAPALAEGAASRPSTGSPAAERIDQVAGGQPGASRENIRSGTISAPLPATPTAKQRDPDTAADPVTQQSIDRPADAPPKPADANAGKPVDAGTPAGAGKPADPSTPSNPGKAADHAKPTVLSKRGVPPIGGGPPQRSARRSPAGVTHERLARAREIFEKFDVGKAAPPR